jgi:hypothetical protein
MLLQKKDNGTLVEILDVLEVINPTHPKVMAKVQAGQEEQEPEAIQKQNLMFPSGENLPLCWVDADYRQK